MATLQSLVDFCFKGAGSIKVLRATRVEKPVLQLGCCRCWVGLDYLCELLTLISLCGDVAIGAFQTNFFANMSISDEFACCPLAIGKNTFDMPHVVHWELRHLDYAALGSAPRNSSVWRKYVDRKKLIQTQLSHGHRETRWPFCQAGNMSSRMFKDF